MEKKIMAIKVIALIVGIITAVCAVLLVIWPSGYNLEPAKAIIVSRGVF